MRPCTLPPKKLFGLDRLQREADASSEKYEASSSCHTSSTAKGSGGVGSSAVHASQMASGSLTSAFYSPSGP